MKIVFMGTPDFATGILESILQSNEHEICMVVTSVDKPAGRGMKLTESSVKQFAKQHDLPLLQPEKLTDIHFIETLKSLNADIFVVVAFRMLPKVVWAIPPKGTINLHASLLPQYRGAAPINWAIIKGETKTGVTTFFINEKIDEGNLILSQEIPILLEDNAGILHDKLLEIGKDTVLKTLFRIGKGSVAEKRQEELEVKYAPKIFKKDCMINWNLSSKEIYNFIRGLSPYPAAFTTFKNPNGENQTLKIYKSKPEITTPTSNIGEIETDNKNYLKIACFDGYIYVEELQLVGKKRMAIKDFLLGNKTLNAVRLDV